MLGHALDGTFTASEFAGRQRKPGDEGHLLFFAIFQHIFRAAIRQAVAILDAYDGNDRLRVLNLGDAHFRQADVFNFSFGLQCFERSELIVGRNFRIDSMQLIKIDALETQAPQAAFASGSQMLGLAIFHPPVGTWPLEAALCGDHKIRRIRMQSLSNNFLAHCRPIGIRSVDEIDSQFHSAPQHANTFRAIYRLAPNSISRDAHAAESQSRHAEIVSDAELTSLTGEFRNLGRGFEFAHVLFSYTCDAKKVRSILQREIRERSSHRQNDAKFRFSAHHARISFGRLCERILFNHWPHAGQFREAQRVL